MLMTCRATDSGLGRSELKCDMEHCLGKGEAALNHLQIQLSTERGQQDCMGTDNDGRVLYVRLSLSLKEAELVTKSKANNGLT